MKYVLVLLAAMISQVVMANEYDFYNADMQSMLKFFKEGQEGIDTGPILWKTEEYRETLQGGAETMFREIYAKAVEEDYNLTDEDNIPTFIQLSRICTQEVIGLLKERDTDRLGAEGLKTYAKIANCGSIINYSRRGFNWFRYNNKEFLKEHGYYERVEGLAHAAESAVKAVDENGFWYLAYLLDRLEQ